VVLNREHYPAKLKQKNDRVRVKIGNQKFEIDTHWRLGDPLLHAKVDGQKICVQVDRLGVGYRLSHAGGQAEAMVLQPRQAELAKLMPVKAAPDTSKFLLSPMPGLLVSVAVQTGQEVKAGEALAVVEAMKMENVLKAGRDGVIGSIHAQPGESLRVDQKILEFA
jgi:propionyl-CoA carboxylase alpha chain